MQSDFTSTTGVDGSIFVTSSQDTEDSATVTEDVAHSLVESLSKVKLPHITSDEQSDLFTIIKCIGGVEKHLTSIDGPATRFVFGLLWRNGQQHQGLLNQGNTNWGRYCGRTKAVVRISWLILFHDNLEENALATCLRERTVPLAYRYRCCCEYSFH